MFFYRDEKGEVGGTFEADLVGESSIPKSYKYAH